MVVMVSALVYLIVVCINKTVTSSFPRPPVEPTKFDDPIYKNCTTGRQDPNMSQEANPTNSIEIRTFKMRSSCRSILIQFQLAEIINGCGLGMKNSPFMPLE